MGEERVKTFVNFHFFPMLVARTIEKFGGTCFNARTFLTISHCLCSLLYPVFTFVFLVICILR